MKTESTEKSTRTEPPSPAPVRDQLHARRTDNHSRSSVAGTEVPVIILGEGVTAVATTRCLSRGGITVYCASKEDAYLRHCRWYSPVPGAPDSLNHASRLNDYLRSLKLEKAVLMPCSDAWVLAAAEIADDLKNRFYTSLPSPEIARRLIDKMTLGGLLNELDIPHPRSLPITGENHLRSVFAEFNGTYFLKPRNSQRFHDQFGLKAFLVGSIQEALEKYRLVTTAGLGVILQEYIPGPASNHYYVEGFLDRNGVFQAWFARRRLRIYPPLFGNSTYMESIGLPLNHQAFAFAAIRHLMIATGFRGIFSAEFKKDERDFHYRLLEVNIRPWWYVEVPYRCGIDVVTMAYHDALEHDVSFACDYAVGKRFFSPYYDYSACKEAHRMGQLSLREWGKQWLSAQQIFFAWDDPMPTVYAAFKLAVAKVRQMFRFGQRPKAAGSKAG